MIDSKTMSMNQRLCRILGIEGNATRATIVLDARDAPRVTIERVIRFQDGEIAHAAQEFRLVPLETRGTTEGHDAPQPASIPE